MTDSTSPSTRPACNPTTPPTTLFAPRHRLPASRSDQGPFTPPSHLVWNQSDRSGRSPAGPTIHDGNCVSTGTSPVLRPVPLGRSPADSVLLPGCRCLASLPNRRGLSSSDSRELRPPPTPSSSTSARLRPPWDPHRPPAGATSTSGSRPPSSLRTHALRVHFRLTPSASGFSPFR